MKKLLLILAAITTVACDVEKVYNREDMTVEYIAYCAESLKLFHATTSKEFDRFINMLCHDTAVHTYFNRVVYEGGVPQPEVLAPCILRHSLLSTLLFFEDGICWQCYNSSGPYEYCLLEWSADRRTQTIKLISPCLKKKGCKNAETELKLVAKGKHPYFGDNVYMLEGLQPYENEREGDFVQYFIDATPNSGRRASLIEEMCKDSAGSC